MNAILTETGFAFNATEYATIHGNDQLIKLQKRYTIRTVDRTTKIPQVTRRFQMIKAGDAKIIEFPRFCMNELMSDVPSAKRPIKYVDIQLPSHRQLNCLEYIGKSNPNQQVVVKHIVDKFTKANDISGTTLRLNAGLGKSFVAMDVIGSIKLKTLVVVPNSYLLDQWVVLLKEYFPHATIGTLYGKQKTDGDIIVSIINTAAELKSFTTTEKKPLPYVGKTLKYPKILQEIEVDDILKNVGLTIFDESQMYVSKEFRKVFRRIWSRFTLGLSATPDIREDKLDIIHQSWLGPILDAASLEGFNMSQDQFISHAKMIEYYALNDNCKFNVREDGMIDYSSIVEAIITDPDRNNVIIDQVIELMKAGHYTFVFSDRRSHLEHLYGMLEERCCAMGIQSEIELPEAEKKIILYGGSTVDTIETAKKRSTVILTTYAYSSTGVSITKMDALVLSTPRRSNMKQIINRVFRLGSDQTIRRVIVDIVDAKMPIKGQVRERVVAYKERGSVILKSKVIAL